MSEAALCVSYWPEDFAEAARAAEAADEFGLIEDARQRVFLFVPGYYRRRAVLARSARSVRVAYEDARCAGRLQGHCVFEGALLFSEWARSTARWVYVLLGADGALYCGSTNNLRRRVREHRAGAGAAVTAVKSQRWFLLHAERFADAQGGFAAELALLRSERLQHALLAAKAPRAVMLHERFDVVVPWLGLGELVPDADAELARVEYAARAAKRAEARLERAAKLRRKLAKVPWLYSAAELEAEVERRLNGGAPRFRVEFFGQLLKARPKGRRRGVYRSMEVA